ALAGIYPPLIWINGMILTEGLFTFLLTLYLFTALQALGNKRRGLSFLSGAVLGMASLVRPSAALFPLAVLGYFLVDPQVPRKEILKKTALTLLAMALVMSPWWVRNYREFHRFVPFSTESGWIFLQGTYPYQEFGKHHREIRASWPVGRDELETNELRFALGMKRAAAWLKNDFSSFWRHYLIEKPKHLWNYTYTGTFGRIPREDIDKFHRWLLRLALAGILLSMFLGPRLYSGPLAMVLLYFTAVHAVFLAIPRFALPATPVIFVFAAYLAVKAIGFLTGLPKRAMGF
ncbi:glycosyltransferase family 39 protein, partial [Calderihabitans maritimus]